MPARLVAVLDADVLVPILSCDLLLSAFEHDLFQPVVTPKILTEVEHTLIDDFAHLDPAALTRRATQLAHALRLHTLPDPTITDAVESVNRKDRHVVAAALTAKANLVVTNDKRLRRETTGMGESLRATTADGFMVTLDKSSPESIDAALDAMIAKRLRRPITKPELLNQLTASFPEFANRAKRTQR
ncbi:MAG: PIN domain-containing protein [Ilumatobacteraceae bacterium]